ncbi:hypothetical protein RhiirA5_393737 [Rhizophagus irregularis]|uniref:Uncharacterized protein n=1 Tax=Rhizophagus irregularis TaxID=588596 RepID=A0A2N0QE77_9GLOM|nr:hypothetical protein RhiirA5_393737 [Rhizophagus irregularis]
MFGRNWNIDTCQNGVVTTSQGAFNFSTTAPKKNPSTTCCFYVCRYLIQNNFGLCDDRGTKFLKEAGLKLPKVLKDMLVKLMKKVDWNRERCAKMQTVGIIHTGLMIMMVHLDNPQGYICRIQRGEVMEVPDNLEKFSSVLKILAAVLNLKIVIKETLKVIQKETSRHKSAPVIWLHVNTEKGKEGEEWKCLCRSE